jgi:hypothetical protein
MLQIVDAQMVPSKSPDKLFAHLVNHNVKNVKITLLTV